MIGPHRWTVHPGIRQFSPTVMPKARVKSVGFRVIRSRGITRESRSPAVIGDR